MFNSEEIYGAAFMDELEKIGTLTSVLKSISPKSPRLSDVKKLKRLHSAAKKSETNLDFKWINAGRDPIKYERAKSLALKRFNQQISIRDRIGDYIGNVKLMNRIDGLKI